MEYFIDNLLSLSSGTEIPWAEISKSKSNDNYGNFIFGVYLYTQIYAPAHKIINLNYVCGWVLCQMLYLFNCAINCNVPHIQPMYGVIK